MNRSKRGHASGSNSISLDFVFFGGFGMSDQPEGERPTPPSIELNIIDTWKLKRPSCLPLLPPQFFPAIGKVAYAWGTFETLFENLLIAVMKASGNPNENWRRITFRKRRTLCQHKMREVLDQCPAAIADIDKALTGSESSYLKRNLVVHGKMGVRLHTSEQNGVQIAATILQCTGRYNGQDLMQEFTVDDLDDLYYEIAHHSGLINAVCTADLGLPQSSPETQLLRDFLSNNHPTYPNPTMLAPRP